MPVALARSGHTGFSDLAVQEPVSPRKQPLRRVRHLRWLVLAGSESGPRQL